MPYYDQSRLDRISSTLSSGKATPSVSRVELVRTYRSTSPKGYAVPVPDHVADPYGGFLSRTYAARQAPDAIYVRDTGHPFASAKWFGKPVSFRTKQLGYYYVYDYSNVRLAPAGTAPALQNWGSSSWTVPVPSYGDLAAFGQQAIASRAPASAAFEMSQFLGELKEGLPSLIGSALIKGRVKDVLRNAGGEYLNVQFGWLPMVSDLKKLCSILLDTEAVLANRKGKQGRPQHTTFSPPEVLSSDTSTTAVQATAAGCGDRLITLDESVISAAGRYGAHLSGDARYSVASTSISLRDCAITRTASRKRKFTGSFTSSFPYPGADASWLEKASALMNWELTPQVLWELAPWSWLVDWFLRIQSTIESNSIAGDKRIVMNYGYVTQLDTYRVLITGIPVERSNPDLSVNPMSVSTVEEFTFVRRVRANPFGFQVSTFQGLNPSQVSILAALGLSRSR